MSAQPVAPELVGHEERGLLYRVGDVGDLEARLALLLGDRLLAERLGEAGRNWVSREHVWSRAIERYEVVYASARQRAQQANP